MNNHPEHAPHTGESAATTGITRDDAIDSPARRDAVAKLAIMAAWTAPTLTVLMRSKRASATSAQSENSVPDPDQNY